MTLYNKTKEQLSRIMVYDYYANTNNVSSTSTSDYSLYETIYVSYTQMSYYRIIYYTMYFITQNKKPIAMYLTI